jgi:hypothetical protein
MLFGVSFVEAREVDEVSEITAAIDNLEASVLGYQSKAGQPNMPLIEARQRVALAHAELQAATDALQVEEQKGSWSDQLDEKIRENAFPSIMGSFLLGDLEFWRKSSRFLLPPNRWRDPLLAVASE